MSTDGPGAPVRTSISPTWMPAAVGLVKATVTESIQRARRASLRVLSGVSDAALEGQHRETPLAAVRRPTAGCDP